MGSVKKANDREETKTQVIRFALLALAESLADEFRHGKSSSKIRLRLLASLE